VLPARMSRARVAAQYGAPGLRRQPRSRRSRGLVRKRLEQEPETEPHAHGTATWLGSSAIGVETADMLVNEVLSRPMRDRKAVARYAGLTGLARTRERGEAAGTRARQSRQCPGPPRYDPTRLAIPAVSTETAHWRGGTRPALPITVPPRAKR